MRPVGEETERRGEIMNDVEDTNEPEGIDGDSLLAMLSNKTLTKEEVDLLIAKADFAGALSYLSKTRSVYNTDVVIEAQQAGARVLVAQAALEASKK